MSKNPGDLVPEIDMKDWRLDLKKLEELDRVEVEDEEDPKKMRNKFMNTVVTAGDLSISNIDDYQIFAGKHYTKVKTIMEADNDTDYKQETLLHSLVSQIDRTKHWKLWAKFILDVAEVMKIPILVAKSKNTNSTCLHHAIEKDEVDFITFVGTISDREVIRSAIATTNSRGQNCVHLAIAEVDKVKKSSFELVDYLTQNANPESLKTKRGRVEQDDMGVGNTCLHDLVHICRCKALNRKCRVEGCTHKQCKNAQNPSREYSSAYLKVLRTMAKKCPDAMTTMNEAEQSPFLFHVHTRSRDKATDPWKRLELSLTDDNVEDVSNLKERPTSEAVAKNQGSSAQHNESTSRPVHEKPKQEYSRALATDISKELMELCLSQLSFSNVCDSLFGHKYPSSELMFKAAPLTERTTETHKALSLEPILACVELGLDDSSSSVLDGYSAPGAVRGALEEDVRKKREDAREKREQLIEDFFTWLRDVKGVKRIIKLVVSDHPYVPCRDKFISNALKGFDIRYLDWDKEDLCMQSLAEDGIAPNLRELWLSWSGRNSTLLGWSNKEDGLWKLEKLETVYVSTGTQWEEHSTNQKNLGKFTTNMSRFTTNPSQCKNHPQCEPCEISLALKGNRDGIVVKMADDGDSRPIFDAKHSTGQEVQGALKQGNIWIEAVRDFQTALNKKVSRERRNKVSGKVTVAIIDDGVDLEALGTVDYIAGGWHPDRKAPDRRAMNAWYFSEKNHGTEMAKLVQLVCPFVSLYVAKLDTRRLVYKSVAQSAAKAIGASIAHGASVISMSWTMYQAGDNNEGIKELADAIKNAGNEFKDEDGETRNTLMFCASEDSGYSSYRQPYPATNCDTNIIKRVGSAGIYGERSDYVDPKAIDYLFPGEIVSSQKLCSGSSASTALAAGLSALILWCAALVKEETTVPSCTTEAGKQSGGQPNRDASAKGSRTAGIAAPPPTVKSPERLNFQTHQHMYGLFDALKSSSENPLVDITAHLHQAAADDNPPAKLIELCEKLEQARLISGAK